MSEVVKVSPYFSERIWGGQELSSYGFQIPHDKKIGEAWVISTLENGSSRISNSNLTLEQFLAANKEIFRFKNDKYPLLTKVITASDDLSIQVHPDDSYALKHHNSFGKPECWYVLDCPDDAELIYGHFAETKEQLEDLVEHKRWSELFKKVKIKKGDFLYVPPGKIHAITKGVVVYELQRSSDITYRFYDYDRKDANGNLRQLHLKECIDVTLVPDLDIGIKNISNGLLISNEYFTLYVASQTQELKLIKNTNWVQVTVLNGECKINDIKFAQGESGILYNLQSNVLQIEQLNNALIMIAHD